MARIAVVDDTNVERMLIAGLLRTNPQFEVSVAENAAEALQQFDKAPPDLVVTDLIMPGMNGFELVRHMQALFPQAPVIVMTAYGNESIAIQALDAGAASYVPKARQAECLMETVQRVLSRAEAEQQRNLLAECMTELHCSFTIPDDHAPRPSKRRRRADNRSFAARGFSLVQATHAP